MFLELNCAHTAWFQRFKGSTFRRREHAIEPGVRLRFAAMGKGHFLKKKNSLTSLVARLKEIQAKMPFQDDSDQSEERPLPRNMKDKHRCWLIAGLKHLQMPLVARSSMRLLCSISL